MTRDARTPDAEPGIVDPLVGSPLPEEGLVVMLLAPAFTAQVNGSGGVGLSSMRALRETAPDVA